MFISLELLWISKISLVSIGIKSTEKNFTTHFNPVFFFILLIVKYFEHYLNTVHNLLFMSYLL